MYIRKSTRLNCFKGPIPYWRRWAGCRIPALILDDAKFLSTIVVLKFLYAEKGVFSCNELCSHGSPQEYHKMPPTHDHLV